MYTSTSVPFRTEMLKPQLQVEVKKEVSTTAMQQKLNLTSPNQRFKALNISDRTGQKYLAQLFSTKRWT